MELFLAELKRNWIEYRRYPFEAIGGIFITTTIFYGLFLSARYIAGPALQLGERLDAVIVGYVLWTLVLFILANLGVVLQIEAQTGTLEQLFLSKYGATRVFLTRSLANLAIQLVLNFSILLIIMTLTGRWLSFSLQMLPPLVAILLGAYGLAFSIGSLALLFKRIQQLQSIFQFGILFLLATPTETWTGLGRSIAQILPMTTAAGLLRDVMARNLALNFQSLFWAFVNGGIYLGLGLLLFSWAGREVRRRGKLAGY
jgi:ABC-2 type transport system permease protein